MTGQVNRVQQQAKTGSTLTYNEIVKLRAAEEKEYTIQGVYKFGYRNKEDVSNLPPNTMVVGSQNVLTNAAEQIAIRNGYQLDGPAGTQSTIIDSNFDLQTASGLIRNIRKWGTTLEVRYVNPVTKAVSWIALTGLTGTSSFLQILSNYVCNFCSFFDQNTEQKMFALFVNHSNAIYEWSGGVGSVASATSNSVTMQGSLNTDQLGFYSNSNNSGKFQFESGGTVYTYTSAGTIATTAFTGSGSNTGSAITPTAWWSQKFTTGGAAQSITSVAMSVYWNNTVSNASAVVNLTGQIYTDNAGIPGTAIGVPVSASVVVGSAGTFGPANFNFAPLSVAQATNYHFVVSSDQTQYLFVIKDTNSGQGTNTSVSGVGWTTQNGPLNIVIIENDTSPQTLNGVSPNPSALVVGAEVIQVVALGSSTQGVSGLPSNFIFDLIANEAGQVWYGNLVSTGVYVSVQGNYKSVAYTATGRLYGEGAFIILDAPPVGFKQQGQLMYCSAGLDEWWLEVRQKLSYSYTYVIGSTPTTVTVVTENLTMGKLKTASLQGAQSQSLIGQMKNALIYVSNEPIFNSFGPVKNVYQEPQIVNMSDPIKYDVDAYSFNNGQVFYYNYYIYITVPAQGVVRIYNVRNKYWEAPQLLPISRFYLVAGQLYGHSSLTNESYQMFVGNSDNGNPISSVIAFPYVSAEGGATNQLKNFNKHYTEGYIAANTTILLTINYDFGGFTGTYTTSISGTEAGIIFNRIVDGSLGQNSLGSEPTGSILNLPSPSALPKFRIISTMPRLDCFEYQIVFSSDDIDMNYSILRSGPAVAPSASKPVMQTI